MTRRTSDPASMPFERPSRASECQGSASTTERERKEERERRKRFRAQS